MIRANTCGEADAPPGSAVIYDVHGRVLHLRHGTPTKQIVTPEQRRAAKAKRKAQRAARRAGRT